MIEYAGELETHLTIRIDESKNVDELRMWGLENGLKCLHIILARGDHPSQPMLTRRAKGKLCEEIAVARRLKDALDAEGFAVQRIKIEAAPWNEGVPQTVADLKGDAPEKYFESHVKILADDRQPLVELTAAVEKHSAHLSRNALRVRPDGSRERFVTLRCPSVGYIEAAVKLKRLITEIEHLGYPVVDVKEEYVIYDDNLPIDAGDDRFAAELFDHLI